MKQDRAKQIIGELVKKYEEVAKSGKLKTYSEEETKKDFILPLFEALGWDVFSRDEVTAEEQITGKRVDYGFYLNGIIKFYLEAKPLKADIHSEDYARQATRYSWNKGVPWAVLTDFESLIVFNALSPEKSLHGKKYFEISYREYLERFDQLWLLSKEAFSQNLLDREAERHGKKLQKVSVTENLVKDLNECRQILTKAFVTWNEKVPHDLIDEGVQRLLDRLIFIRAAEDRRIEPPTLRPIVNEWIASGRKKYLYQTMIDKFRELDTIYNSNLFSPHAFEQWEEHADATKEVIDILYGKNSYFEYDFSVIPADVLGNVYENYLGYKLQKSKNKNLFGEGVELDKNARKRKDQGIYYTPKYIVNFIVKETLGPALDKCKSISDLQKLKVLDPACGSGSFLVAAFNFILEKYKEFGSDSKNPFVRAQVLRQNIYGVDLDQQAVELARLNLLLNTFSSKIKLPDLADNIKNGNSLVSGTDEELEKYFGRNYRDKKPFNWQEEFPGVFKKGGFDVIVGNPPYISVKRGVPEGENKYYIDNFVCAESQYDLFALFLERALVNLKNDGYIGFIVPKQLLTNVSFRTCRKFMLEKSKEVKLVNTGMPFPEASVETIIIVVNKGSSNHDTPIIIDELLLNGNSGAKAASTLGFLATNNPDLLINIDQNPIAKKLQIRFDKKSTRLGDLFFIIRGLEIGKKDKRILTEPNSDSIPLIRGEDLSRYGDIDPRFFIKERDIDKKVTVKGKIMVRRVASNIIASIDEGENCTLNTIYNLLSKNENTYLNGYILALLNSRLINYLFKSINPIDDKLFPYIRVFQLREIPIFNIDPNNPRQKLAYKNITKLAEKMLRFHKKLRKSPVDSNNWKDLKKYLELTDKKIDNEVYKLYGLTPEEIKIVG